MRHHEKHQGIATHGLLGKSESLVKLALMAGIPLSGVDANSNKTPSLSLWVEAMIRESAAVSDHPSPVLLAHSLGTWATLNAAITLPQARVVLLSPTCRVRGTRRLAAKVPNITVITGTHDLVTEPTNDGAKIAMASPGGKHIVLPGLTHSGFLPGFGIPAPVRWLESTVSAMGNGAAPPLPSDVQQEVMVSALRREIFGED